MNTEEVIAMTDAQAIQSHPAFLAYRGNNVKPVDTVDTQLETARIDKNEPSEQEKNVGGGEGGKA
jgi:hypothetical protein